MKIKKQNKANHFIWYILLYLLAIVLVFIPIWNIHFILPIILMSVSHIVICSIEIVLSKFKNFSDTKIFMVDHILHLICITLLSIYITKESIPITSNVIVSWLKYLNIDYLFVVKFLVLLLGNIIPCNFLIKTTVQHYKPKNNDPTTDTNNSSIGAGAVIGVLERFLIIIFFVNAQYSLIGLVLTAKSIARFSQLSENKDFAEYYLMGTLLSVLFAISLCIITF